MSEQEARPSRQLLRDFADHEKTIRAEIDRYREAAAEETAAATDIQAHIDANAARVRELLAEVERVKAAMADAQAEADKHRHRAAVFTQRAEERVPDIAYLRAALARAEQRPEFAPQCVCGLPDTPDAAARRATCPLHATEEPAPEPPAGAGDVVVAESGPNLTQPDVSAVEAAPPEPDGPRHAKPKERSGRGTGEFRQIIRRAFGPGDDITQEA